MKITSTVERADQELPGHPDGGFWQHVLLHGDGRQTVADTAGELLELVIPGYGSVGDDTAALTARMDHAIGAASAIQHGAIQEALSSGWDPGDDTAMTALMSDKDQSLDYSLLQVPEGQPLVWEHPVLLVLVASYYQPYSGPPAPTGASVVLLDPYTEAGYLSCLHELGLVVYARRDPEAAGAA